MAIPKAGIYRHHGAATYLPVFLQHLKIIVRGVGRVGTRDDVDLLKQISEMVFSCPTQWYTGKSAICGSDHGMDRQCHPKHHHRQLAFCLSEGDISRGRSAVGEASPFCP
jgi:hypothetical protein